jgi:hypothetical protein
LAAAKSTRFCNSATCSSSTRPHRQTPQIHPALIFQSSES